MASRSDAALTMAVAGVVAAGWYMAKKRASKAEPATDAEGPEQLLATNRRTRLLSSTLVDSDSENDSGNERPTQRSPRRPSRLSADSSHTEGSLRPRAPHPIYTMVLTGGPCAGKTTAMARLANFLRGRGFRVYTVPESATMLFTNGATFADLGTDEKEMRFQINLLKTQMHLEDTFYNLGCDCGAPAVLLCDRGTMDGSAYIPRPVWNVLMRKMNTTIVRMRDERYNAVIHLVTAANGAEQYYTLANNETRTETPEQARAIDMKLQQAWVGHPALTIIDNSTDFEGKLRRCVDTVARLVGLPSSKRAVRKFLLKSPPDLHAMDVAHESFEVNKVYLMMKPKVDLDRLTKHDESKSSAQPYYPFSFVRRRQQLGEGGALAMPSFASTSVDKGPDGQEVELKRIISHREYKVMAAQADPSRRIVRQTRTSFLWRDRFYEINVYRRPCEGLAVVNVQVAGEDDGDSVPMPPGLEVEREVTGDKKYSSYYLSLRSTGLAKISEKK